MANFYGRYPVSGSGSGAGVISLNSLTGALSIVAGTNITVTPSGSSITIASSNPGGTVTSVALTAPSILSVSGSPITTSGTLALSLATQAANLVWAGPTSGSAMGPTFRSLVAADIPALSYVTSVGVAAPGIFAVTGTPITSSGTISITLLTQAANLVWAGPTSGSAMGPTFRSLVTADLPSVAGNSNILKAPTIQQFTSGTATYTTPTSPAPLYLRIRMVGGGGGGAGSGTASSSSSGNNGGSSIFGISYIVANGGAGCPYAGTASGGTATLGSGPIGIALTGAGGGNPGLLDSAGTQISGGDGGSTPFGGAGACGGAGGMGNAGAANTGSGGGGGGASNTAGCWAGGGGGAGGFIDAIISSPASSYIYAVGNGGTGGSAGTNGFAGGAGAYGYIVVEEHYQ